MIILFTPNGWIKSNPGLDDLKDENNLIFLIQKFGANKVPGISFVSFCIKVDK